jgi:RNA polymerase sigma-70 factor, ECF subfamily
VTSSTDTLDRGGRATVALSRRAFDFDESVAAELVARYQAGDVGAFDALYERFRPRIYDYLRRMAGSREDAEDLTQKVFLRVLEEELSGQQPDWASFSGWLWRVAHNAAIDHHRRSGHATATPPDALIDQLDGAANPPEVEPPGWNSVELEEAFDAAAASHRQILMLFYLYDLGPAEVGALIGRTPAAADKLRRRALAALRARLSDERS